MEDFYNWLKVRFSSGVPPTIRLELEHKDNGIAWAGFWIGLGIVMAADIITNHHTLF